MTAQTVLEQLKANANPERAKSSARFFKTGPGDYGEGDQFLGLAVPQQRIVAKRFQALPLDEIIKLLRMPYHECRLTALFILVGQYKQGDDSQKLAIYMAYLANTAYINNWDLIDSSASYIVGPQLGNNYRKVLLPLAHSKLLWERRIAMLACFYTIAQGNPRAAFEIIDILQNDSHDLIQKAVGWMLREIGKRCGRQTLNDWLLDGKRYQKLPRTTLRYAIEHYFTEERRAFLKGTA
jgi:3-methyladenine DNA glycosylase AlkD